MSTDDLTLWPRIEAAIYATTVSRSAVEFAWPECNRAKCQHQHGDPDDAFRMMISRVAESVHTELLCRATTDPDLGEIL